MSTPMAPHDDRRQLMAYVAGFVISIVLTLEAYVIVTQRAFSPHWQFGIIVGLGLIQFVVQLLFFLHLGQESRPRWRLKALLFMTMVVVILVGGSIWIMHNLNYHMLPPGEQSQYLQTHEGL